MAKANSVEAEIKQILAGFCLYAQTHDMVSENGVLAIGKGCRQISSVLDRGVKRGPIRLIEAKGVDKSSKTHYYYELTDDVLQALKNSRSER